MKISILGLCIALPLLSSDSESYSDPIQEESIIIDTIDPINTIDEIPTKPIHNLIDAMIMVESRGKDSCIGDKHLSSPSIGVLQIRPVMVREVNRFLKKMKSDIRYDMDDRWSREKSIEMFLVWKNYQHSNDSFEIIARCWNGGPRGMKKTTTIHYWNKVQKYLK